MILKIIVFTFLYLLCGVGVLELFKLHDRHVEDYEYQWLENDESEGIIITLFFPIYLMFTIPWLIGKFIRVVEIIFTALTYIVMALIKSKDKKEGDDIK